MDWTEKYVKKFLRSNLNEESKQKIQIAIQNTVNRVNNEFKENALSDYEVNLDLEKNEITFPDCIISYNFVKDNKGNDIMSFGKCGKHDSNKLKSLRIGYQNGCYHIIEFELGKEIVNPTNYDNIDGCILNDVIGLLVV